MPKVSIVVPVCNVQNYISECLESILAQTLTDIEIICIDDGSTDDSGQILDVYAKKDARIRVVHKANSGYGESMNVGFDMAVGEYIGIVESDDFIKPEMYEVLYSKAKEYDLDLIKSNAVFWWGNIDLQDSSYKKNLESFYNKVLGPQNRKIMFQFFMNTWTGIYKKEFLDKYNIRHNTTPGASYQDNGFWIQTLCFCKRAMWLKDAFYFYRQDNPLASIKSKSKVYAMLEEYKYVSELLKNRVGEVEEGICTYYRMFRHRGTFLRIDDTLKREFCDTIIEEYKKYSSYVAHDVSIKEWFEQICSNPDEACNNVITKKAALHTRFENAEQMVIYGAGQRAKSVIKRIYNIGVFGKVSAILVTEKGEQQELAKIPIYRFDEFTDYDKNTLFIIAVSENADTYQNIAAGLKSKGIGNFIESRDLVQLFYSIS